MRVLSVETFQIIFDKQITLTSAYTDNTSTAFIIKSCRLKPYDIIFSEYSEKIKLYNKWIDEYGNYLEITNKKKILIKLNDLSIDKSKITSSDIYENLPIDKIAKVSKFIFSLIAKDEDNLEDHVILSFLGIDGFLRTYCLIYGEWSKIPSLYLGYDILNKISAYQDIKYFLNLKIKNTPYPCVDQKACLSFMPPSNDFIAWLKRWNQPALDIIKIGENK